MIKMVATDIDGTIVGNNFVFTEEVKNCMKKLCQNGIKVVLVTGRMHSATIDAARELGLETPIVSYQGGLIKEQTGGKVLYEKTMDAKDAKEIILWAKANKIHLNLYMNDKLFVEEDNESIKRYTCERNIPYTVCELDKIELKHINKILGIDFKDAERVTSWVNFLRKKYPHLYIVKSTPYFCEVSNNDARKSRAVEFLADYWGIKKEEILTIGDQNNDIELLKAGGIPVAMGNATDELKKYAKYITDTVDNNGFVKAVEKFVLKEGLHV